MDFTPVNFNAIITHFHGVIPRLVPNPLATHEPPKMHPLVASNAMSVRAGEWGFIPGGVWLYSQQGERRVRMILVGNISVLEVADDPVH